MILLFDNAIGVVLAHDVQNNGVPVWFVIVPYMWVIAHAKHQL
jgi:hypothetical protein